MLVITRSARKGFSLIELMIVIAILGIVAAIAIPAYQDYVTRSRITGMINALDVIKLGVAEYRQVNGSLAGIDPADSAATFAAIGVEDPTNLSRAISQVVFAKENDNTMAIVACGSTEGQGTEDADTVDIYFTGVITLSGIRWNCAYAGNSKFVPSSCRVPYDPAIYGALGTACNHTIYNIPNPL